MSTFLYNILQIQDVVIQVSGGPKPINPYGHTSVCPYGHMYFVANQICVVHE